MSEDEAAADAAKEESTWFVGRMLAATVLVVVVFAYQAGGYGALASPKTLLAELHGVVEEPLEQPWGLGEELPYRYRPLFRAVVLAVYAQAPHSAGTFYGVFITCSALSLLLALLAFEWLLRELKFSNKEALAGMVLLALGFPVLFSYDMPIHTREDFLGYAWIALTLVAVVRDRPYAVAGMGIVGAAIRETCLLGVLPFWFVSQRSKQHKVMAYALPGLAWLILRLVRGAGQPRYDYLGVSTAPTLEFPAEALLYLFACFGCLWLAAGLRLFASDAPPRHPLLSRKVVLLAFAATALTGWTLGMVREARITYILFPFVIPLALETFSGPRVRRMLRSPWPWVAAVSVLVLGGAFLIWLGGDPNARVYALRGVFGDSFHFGVAPVEVMQIEGAQVAVEMTYASPLNGPHVLLNLAVVAFLFVGTAAEPKPGVGPTPADAPAAP